jgi:hypothetical protein
MTKKEAKVYSAMRIIYVAQKTIVKSKIMRGQLSGKQCFFLH